VCLTLRWANISTPPVRAWGAGISQQPPHGLQLSSFRSMRYLSMPPLANVSAAEPPAGPPPMTATLRLRCSLGLDLLAVIRKRRYVKGELGVMWEWSNFGCSRRSAGVRWRIWRQQTKSCCCGGLERVWGFKFRFFCFPVRNWALILKLCKETKMFLTWN